MILLFQNVLFFLSGCVASRKGDHTMATSNKNLHLTDDERKIIQRGIENNSSKKSIADTLGKDKSTIGKEIKNHRTLSYKSKYPVECVDTGKCPNKYSHHCSMDCPAFKPFICKRRDRSPGACNGCERYKRCRFDKYMYDASAAQKEYAELLCDARAGVNATVNEIRDLGLLIKPLLEQGQSLYVICQNHPEIKVSDRTLYTYIEDGVFQDAGVSITNLDLKRKVRRKIPKNKRIPIKNGCNSVAHIIKLPTELAAAPIAGAHNTLKPTPASIVAVGVTRISTFVSLETNLPTSLATIAIRYTAKGPPAPPNSFAEAPTAINENNTSCGACNA